MQTSTQQHNRINIFNEYLGTNMPKKSNITLPKLLKKKKYNYNCGVSVSVITHICMLIVTMCIRNKSKLEMGVE